MLIFQRASVIDSIRLGYLESFIFNLNLVVYLADLLRHLINHISSANLNVQFLLLINVFDFTELIGNIIVLSFFLGQLLQLSEKTNLLLQDVVPELFVVLRASPYPLIIIEILIDKFAIFKSQSNLPNSQHLVFNFILLESQGY